jgi:hypothetical protein
MNHLLAWSTVSHVNSMCYEPLAFNFNIGTS